MRLSKRAVLLVAAGTGLAMVTAACSSSSSGGGGSGELSGVSLTVGSKEFTEQLILGQIAIQALENAGATVTDKTNITGTTNTRKALDSGQIDMYWEYTGTGWSDILGHSAASAPKDPTALFTAVSKEDLQKNQIKWLPPSTANDTYAIATSQKISASTGVKSLSDYAKLANANPGDAALCVASEFTNRSDGLPGLEKAYGFKLPTSDITEVEYGIIYQQLPTADQCKFGEVFSTDGRVSANKLIVLEDDKSFFVPYDIAMTIRDSVYKQNPKIADVLNPISQKLTENGLAQLNAQVDVQGLPPDAVATKWLQDNGFM